MRGGGESVSVVRGVGRGWDCGGVCGWEFDLGRV